jgi:hypothetical protein
MTVHTSAGSKVHIGTTVAASSLAQYEADTYQEIGEIVTIGEFGRVYDEITHTSIGNRATRKFKGAYNDGNLQLGLGRDAADAGQAAARAALDDDNDYNFKIELNDDSVGDTDSAPTTFYFRGKVMSYTTNIDGVNAVVQSTIAIGIQSGTLIESPEG